MRTARRTSRMPQVRPTPPETIRLLFVTSHPCLLPLSFPFITILFPFFSLPFHSLFSFFFFPSLSFFHSTILFFFLLFFSPTRFSFITVLPFLLIFSYIFFFLTISFSLYSFFSPSPFFSSVHHLGILVYFLRVLFSFPPFSSFFLRVPSSLNFFPLFSSFHLPPTHPPWSSFIPFLVPYSFRIIYHIVRCLLKRLQSIPPPPPLTLLLPLSPFFFPSSPSIPHLFLFLSYTSW